MLKLLGGFDWLFKLLNFLRKYVAYLKGRILLPEKYNSHLQFSTPTSIINLL